MVERFNRTVIEHLKKVVDDHQRDWDNYIPVFLMAYRTAVHNSTGQTPSRLVFGKQIRLPSELKFGTPNQDEKSTDEYIVDLRERLREIHEISRRNLKAASDRMKTRYDLRANSEGFHEGDLVWLFNPRRRKGKSPKLQQQWEGPYKVVTRINDVVYRIQRGPATKKKIVHVDRMCPYLDPGGTTVRDEQL